MPFVTEEIWKQVRRGRSADFLMIRDWPNVVEKRDEKAEKEFAKLQEVIVGIRNIRTENKIVPSEIIEAQIRDVSKELFALIEKLARVSVIDSAAEKKGITAAHVTVYLPQVDAAEEKIRLIQSSEELRAYIFSTEAKLANAEFTAKAPAKVVDAMRMKKAEAEAKLAELQRQLSQF